MTTGSELVAEAIAQQNGRVPTETLRLLRTDVGNAKRLIERHGDDLRYVHPWSAWLVWDGARWQLDDRGEPERRMKETIRWLAANANDLRDDHDRKAWLRFVLDSERAGRVRAALAMAQSEDGVAVTPDELDRDPMLLNVANGTVDLRTGELRDHDRSCLMTKLAPVTYDPDATAPCFAAFLEHVLPDPEVRAFLQRYIGYALTGSVAEQVLAILFGAGANGKSTLIETVRALLGDYGQQAPAETFLERRDGVPNDIARLRGARFVAATEISEGRRLNEALVKRMTGGDTMVARFMRAEWFEFPMTAKVVLATNHRPEIRGTDEAIWRRIRLVPFTVTIPAEKRDPRLPGLLRQELPGILNWAVAGCLAWQSDGLTSPAAVAAATDDYRHDMDVLGGFLDDCCVVGEGVRAKASDLYNRYGYWADASGQRDRLTQQAFGRRLSERGFNQTRTKADRWWVGVGIRDDSRGDG